MKRSRIARAMIALLGCVWTCGGWSAESAPPATRESRKENREDVETSRAERLQELAKNAGPQARRPDIERKLSIDFANLPARDAFEFLEDAHGVQVFLSQGKFRDRAVNLKIQNQPLRDSLDMVCRQLGLDWDTDGYIIYAAPPATAEQFRRLVGTREERRRNYPQAVTKPLQQRVHLDLVETPMEAAVEFLSSTARIPMRVVDDPRLARRRVWFSTGTSGLPLDVVLDLLSAEHSLHWSVGDTGIIVIKYVPREA
jgi:hypothetical protein